MSQERLESLLQENEFKNPVNEIISSSNNIGVDFTRFDSIKSHLPEINAITTKAYEPQVQRYIQKIWV